MKLILPEWATEEMLRAALADWGEEEIVPAAVRMNGMSYGEWLRSKVRARAYVPANFVPSTLLFMTDDDVKKIIGMVDVRHALNGHLVNFGGHIGYGIVPSERGRGYAKEQLRLVLPVARAMGLSRVLITCNDDNPASAKTIIACGGVLEDKREDKGKLVRRYWIDIPMTVIETQRLRLRGWTMEDLEDFYAYAKNPKIGPAAGWKPHESREESREILERFIKEGEAWAIEDKASGRAIGSIGLHADNTRSNTRAKMIGYVLSEAYWGQGLMPEAVRAMTAYAFESLCMSVLSIQHFASNLKSRRVIEKCGYTLEGTLRNAAALRDGTVQDDLLWSMLRTEYLAGKNR